MSTKVVIEDVKLANHGKKLEPIMGMKTLQILFLQLSNLFGILPISKVFSL